MLTLVYSRNDLNLGSLAIRAQAWFGPWSHTGIVVPDGDIIEARLMTGVQKVSRYEFERHATKLEYVDVECPDSNKAIDFAFRQIGKRYDKTAIAGFMFARNWQEDDMWECTELAEAALVAGGRVRFRTGVHRINPTMSYYAR